MSHQPPAPGLVIESFSRPRTRKCISRHVTCSWRHLSWIRTLTLMSDLLFVALVTGFFPPFLARGGVRPRLPSSHLARHPQALNLTSTFHGTTLADTTTPVLPAPLAPMDLRFGEMPPTPPRPVHPGPLRALACALWGCLAACVWEPAKAGGCTRLHCTVVGAALSWRPAVSARLPLG